MSRLTVMGTVVCEEIETANGNSPRYPVLGGSAVYAAAAAQLLCRVNLVGDVGEDFSQTHLHCLQSMNIDLTGFRRLGGTTFYWRARYPKDMRTRETLALELGVYKDHHPHLNAKCRVSKYALLANLRPQAQHEALVQLKCPRVVLLGTIDYWIRNERTDLVSQLSRVTGFIANEEEIKLLAGMSDPIAAAKNVLAFGPRFVVVTLAERGSLLLFGERVFHVPAFPCATLVDPTGAGDSFAGGLLASIARERVAAVCEGSLCRAMLYGTSLASLCVEAFSIDGLRQANLGDVEQRVAQLRRMVHFPT